MNHPSLLRRSKSHRSAAMRNAQAIGRQTIRRVTITANKENSKALADVFNFKRIKVVHTAIVHHGYCVRMVLEMPGNQRIDPSCALYRIESDERIRVIGGRP